MKYLILAIIVLLGMFGCSARPQPKSYVCVEKPPIKVTYIDYDKDITPITVDMMIKHARLVPYRDGCLNDKNEVIINYDTDSQYSSNISNSLNLD